MPEPDEDVHLRQMYKDAREQANTFIRFYLNLRIAAFSFALLSIGAATAFGWNKGFRLPFEDTTDEQKYLRFGVLALIWIILISSSWFEIALSKRYKICWQESKRYENKLEGWGLHSRIEASRAGLRHPARFSYTMLAIGLLAVSIREAPLFFPWWIPRLVSWFTS